MPVVAFRELEFPVTNVKKPKKTAARYYLSLRAWYGRRARSTATFEQIKNTDSRRGRPLVCPGYGRRFLSRKRKTDYTTYRARQCRVTPLFLGIRRRARWARKESVHHSLCPRRCRSRLKRRFPYRL